MTTRTVTAFLGGVCLLQSLAALTGTGGVRENSLGATVCLIAFLHYTWMRTAKNRQEKQELRFGDWFVTCPLLLMELHSMTRNESNLLLQICLVTLMLALGALALGGDEKRRSLFFSLSTIVFLYVTYDFLSKVNHHTEVAYAFFLVWGMYPIAFLSRSDTAFDVLDMASKGLFGLYVASSHE